MLQRFRLWLTIAALLPTVAFADAGATQPNDTLQLQPTTTQGLQSGGQTAQQPATAGLSAPTDSNLQSSPASSKAVNDYLNGELTGGPQSGTSAPAETSERAWWGVGLLVFILVAAGIVGSAMARRDRNRAARELVAETPSEVLPGSIADEEPTTSEGAAPVATMPTKPVKGAGKAAGQSSKHTRKKRHGAKPRKR